MTACCVSRTQVLNSGQESRKSIAPYLAIPALRRVISTFANDPSGQFANWSTNPEVIYRVRPCRSLQLRQPAHQLVLAAHLVGRGGGACMFSCGMQVLAMLDEAKRLIDEGRMTPEELDRNLLINLQVHTA